MHLQSKRLRHRKGVHWNPIAQKATLVLFTEKLPLLKNSLESESPSFKAYICER